MSFFDTTSPLFDGLTLSPVLGAEYPTTLPDERMLVAELDRTQNAGESQTRQASWEIDRVR
jgi:hypothetical protein